MNLEPKLARKIVAYTRRWERPMLEYRHESYQLTLVAMEAYNHFVLKEWAPPFATWRDFWLQEEELLDRIDGKFGIDPDDVPDLNTTEALEEFLTDQGVDLDEVILEWDSDTLQFTVTTGDDYLPAHDSPIASAYGLLANCDVDLHFKCRELDLDLGAIELIEGLYPGNDYVAARWTSLEALSCLQYALDEKGNRIRIELAPA